jgi:hypothetical protein
LPILRAFLQYDIAELDFNITLEGGLTKALSEFYTAPHERRSY